MAIRQTMPICCIAIWIGTPVVLILVLRFCALKLITSNECIAHNAPSFELVQHQNRKYSNSKRAIVTAWHNNSLSHEHIDQMRLLYVN